MIENTCRYCSLTKPCDFAGYCSKECSVSDFTEAYAAHTANQPSAWDHAVVSPGGSRGGKTRKPADLYEGMADGDAWAGADRFDAWEGTDA